jgi:signal transduction histidine kinase
VAAAVFHTELTSQLDDHLEGLQSELRPVIDESSQKPNLKLWYQNVVERHQRLLSTVQLFDGKGQLLEQYGPSGVPHLAAGTLHEQLGGQAISVRSLYRPIGDDNGKAGYIQVQVSTKHMDNAVHQFSITLIILAPLFALLVWLTGYFVSVRASKPIVQTMELLRRFVADAGHEFNTPITVIEASIETLNQVFQEKGLSTDVLDVITRASARMKDLAAKLMFLAQMENPASVANMISLDLGELLSPLIEEFSTLAAQKKIKINWQKAASVTAIGNAESLRTMVSNLVDNALSYTEPGGTIIVNLAAQPTSVTLSVEDTGIGIPPESIAHIFERFYRVDKSRSRAVGGTGLGLSIVKAIVDNHKGTIKAESQVGIGTKFTIVLPLRA